MSTEHRPKLPIRLCAASFSLLVVVVALPILLIGVALLEVAVLGTRHALDATEKIGLIPILQWIFTALGLNG